MAKILNNESFIKQVENSDKVVVVDFFATWCGPCKMLAPVFEELGKEMDSQAEFVKVDIDQSLDIALKYNVSTVPTMMIFKNGEVVDKIIGFVPKENIANKVKLYI
ncbi:thioredoxin [Romboutsia sp.]|uniref:thioredoxin n=1 Tax=Romboutsia sp. TaxID=1965302 RepID=UPI002C8A434F|nr:thioredoxin [Romboutsia sp.]HSQ87448.1 thioredoxin [Romboutsia sp.]